jgi:hypothetical protein
VATALNGLRQLPGFPAEASLEMAAQRFGAWARKTQAASRVGGSEAYKALEATLRTKGASLIKTQEKPGLTRFFEALGDDQAARTADVWLKVYGRTSYPLEQIQPVSFDRIENIMAFQTREQLERLLRYAATLK